MDTDSILPQLLLQLALIAVNALFAATEIAVQDGRILVDLFYETYAESVINGAIQVNVYVVG